MFVFSRNGVLRADAVRGDVFAQAKVQQFSGFAKGRKRKVEEDKRRAPQGCGDAQI